MTRRQTLLAEALRRVQAVPDDAAVRRTYGGLCHTLPVLVRKNGLCQTVAFLQAKSGGATAAEQNAQKRAYALICDHLAAALGRGRETLLPYVAGASLSEYMQATRTVLLAWEFYKRFAVSVLGVESGDAQQEAGESA